MSTSNFANSNYNQSLKTYLIIHGFLSDGNVTWLINMKEKLLSIEDANVIAVDWKQGAALLVDGITSIFAYPPYITAARNVKIVGNKTAYFLNQANINPPYIHCIGHSLGAHACGAIGKIIKLDRITGIKIT